MGLKEHVTFITGSPQDLPLQNCLEAFAGVSGSEEARTCGQCQVFVYETELKLNGRRYEVSRFLPKAKG